MAKIFLLKASKSKFDFFMDDKILKTKVCEITNNDLCKINNMGKKSLIEFNNLRQFK